MSLFTPVPLVIDPIEEPSGEASGAFEALEWGRLLEVVASYARSEVAREWLRALRPSRDPAWIARQHELASEMRLLLREVGEGGEGAPPPLGGLFDPSPLVQRAAIPGASLEAEEIRDLVLLLEAITAWQAFLDRPPQALAGRLAGLTALGQTPPGAGLGRLLRSLRSRMNPDGSLTGDASPGLRRIRKEIERQKRAIEESLRGSLRRLSESGEAQEDLITIRGERFVIPVKSEFKRRIAGVVHGASSSGQTVYLEPLETIERNNELVRLLEEEQGEIRRILLEMSREIGAEAKAMVGGAAALAALDALQAAALFAADFDCVRPQFAPPAEPRLVLEQARHPLLEKRLRAAPGKSIVPLTLALHSEQRQLILSGPNTGGKTVALKTTGLLGMMAQAGIPVPARQAVLPLFTAFFAAMGDAQSIEQNLSTFSAHIANLNRFLSLADASSLVLLDELGSATDPEEGAALAVAIAARFLDLRSWCLISTHHTALKVYAEEHSGALNAAVGVDERTLEPTYELRLGVAGASAGINIAQRLGLDRTIVEDARARLHTQTREISGFLERLHAELDAATRERARLAQREQEVEGEKKRLQSEGLQEWRAKVRGLQQQFEARFQDSFKDLASRIRETAAAVEDRAARQKLTREAERRMARLKREFRAQFDVTGAIGATGKQRDLSSVAEAAELRPPNPPPRSGDMVQLKSMRSSGRVLRQVAGGAFEVAIGSVKLRVAGEDIEKIQHAEESAAAGPPGRARQHGISVSLTHPEAIRSEINVIGRSVEEAAAEVDQFLDQAFLAGLPRVRIVHGIGKGILRKALRAELNRHPHVAQVVDAGQSEGGAGATLVDLRL